MFVFTTLGHGFQTVFQVGFRLMLNRFHHHTKNIKTIKSHPRRTWIHILEVFRSFFYFKCKSLKILQEKFFFLQVFCKTTIIEHAFPGTSLIEKKSENLYRNLEIKYLHTNSLEKFY